MTVVQSCPTLGDPMDAGRQPPLSPGFSRQEHWKGLGQVWSSAYALASTLSCIPTPTRFPASGTFIQLILIGFIDSNLISRFPKFTLAKMLATLKHFNHIRCVQLSCASRTHTHTHTHTHTRHDLALTALTSGCPSVSGLGDLGHKINAHLKLL